MELTSGKKWSASAIAGILFVLVSSPMTYRFVNGLTMAAGLRVANRNGCPNTTGLLIHAVVYALLVRSLMSSKVKNLLNKEDVYEPELTNKDKWTYSAIGGVLFAIVGSPILYKLVNRVTSEAGLMIADSLGCPNVYGLVLHGAVFALVVRGLMTSKAEKVIDEVESGY